MKTALLVIDMQNDFIGLGGIFENPSARQRIHQLASFIAKCRKLNLPVIYTRHIYSPSSNPIERLLFPKLEKGGLRKGSWGFQIYSTIAPKKGDLIIDKRRYDAFFKTRLNKILKRLGVKRLIITGTMTEVCCESTARTAMLHDYHVLFCSDLNYTYSKTRQAHALKTISHHFGKVLSAKQILKLLKKK